MPYRDTHDDARLRAYRLAHAFVLLSWDGGEAIRARHVKVRIDGAMERRPVCGCNLELRDGRVRNVVVLPLTAAESEAAVFAVLNLDGAILAADPDAPALVSRIAPFDAHDVLDGTGNRGAAKVVRFILETCPAVLRVATDAGWAATCRRLIREVTGRVGPLVPRCTLLDRFICCDGLISSGMGERLTAVLLSGPTIKVTPMAPALADVPPKKNKRLFHVLLDAPATDAATTLVVFGEGGVAGRILVGSEAALVPAPWPALAGESAESASRRRYVLDALAQLGGRDQRAAALGREVSVLSDSPRRAADVAAPGLLIEVDLVLAADCGVFVAGRLNDPYGIAERIEVERLGQTRFQAIDEVIRFPLPPTATSTPRPGETTGFATLIPAAGNAPEASCRIALRLKSGLTLPAATGPRLLGWREARDAVLAAVPAPFLTDQAIDRCVEPMVRAQQASHVAASPAPIVVPIGRANGAADISVIVPIGRDAEAPRCRTARLALGKEASRLELIYLVDRAEQVAAAERLLRDLTVCYGLSCRLLVLAGGTAVATALNAGAAAARGRHLLFCGPGSVPATVDWLPTMLAALDGPSVSGAVGACRRNADGSLIASSGGVEEDPFGRWRPVWTHAARRSEAALQPAPLFLSSQALLMPREAFEAVGGFDPAYLDDTGRDADFCLKLVASGRGLAHIDAPLFIEFEEPGPRLPAELLGVARELDRRLFEQRWRARMFEQRWRARIEALRPVLGTTVTATSSSLPRKAAGRGGRRGLASGGRAA